MSKFQYTRQHKVFSEKFTGDPSLSTTVLCQDDIILVPALWWGVTKT